MTPRGRFHFLGPFRLLFFSSKMMAIKSRLLNVPNCETQIMMSEIKCWADGEGGFVEDNEYPGLRNLSP
jgi:hypothetical protein